MKPDGSNAVIGRIADAPLQSPAQSGSIPMPNPDMGPTPVITMRRIGFDIWKDENIENSI
jgi:hypothetical protein